jgi:hypothetical protein
MSKDAKIILVIALFLIIIGAAIYFLWPKKKEPATNQNSADNFTNDPLPQIGATQGNGSNYTPNAATNPYVNNNSSIPYLNNPLTNPLYFLSQGMTSLMNGVSDNSGDTQQAIGTTTGGLGSAALMLTLPQPNPANFPLKYGSRGNEVSRVQAGINQSIRKGTIKGVALVADGIWGAKTENLVRQILPGGTISLDQYKAINVKVAQNQGIV